MRKLTDTDHLFAAATRLERHALKLDTSIIRLREDRDDALSRLTTQIQATISSLETERTAVATLFAEVMQRLNGERAAERAEAVQDENQAAEFAAELEQVQERRLQAEIERRLTSNPLAKFVGEQLHEAPGHLIAFADFYDRFRKWLPVDERLDWSQVRVSKGLPFKFRTGKGSCNKVFLINAAWQPCEAGPAYVVNTAGKIRR